MEMSQERRKLDMSHSTNRTYPPRLSRLRLLLQDEGLDRLQDATVMVLGLGGVGSACAEAFARGGVGHLIILDGDVVDPTNINRQVIAFESTIGRQKSDVMKELILDINPDCDVYAVQEFLQPDNLEATLSALPRPDYVLDCIDTVTQKLGIAQWCAQQHLPLLSSMGAANKLDPAFLTFDWIENTQYCPLSKVIRRECRERGIQKLEVLYSKEIPPKIVRPSVQVKAQTLGSMSYMPPIMGKMIAGKVIRRLAGLETYQQTPRQLPMSVNDYE